MHQIYNAIFDSKFDEKIKRETNKLIGIEAITDDWFTSIKK